MPSWLSLLSVSLLTTSAVWSAPATLFNDEWTGVELTDTQGFSSLVESDPSSLNKEEEPALDTFIPSAPQKVASEDAARALAEAHWHQHKAKYARELVGCPGVKRFLRQSRNRYLAIEVLSDEVIHFETATNRRPPALDRPLYTTQMIDEVHYPKLFCGSPSVVEKNNVIETEKLRVTIQPDSLDAVVFDKGANKVLTTFYYDEQNGKPRLGWTKEETKAVYGIAAAFGADANPTGKEGILGVANGNFLGKYYEAPSAPGKSSNNPRFGNVMAGFDKGAAIFAQFPIMYALGDNNYQWAFFFDNIYGQSWDLTDNNGRFKVAAYGAHRWFVIQGSSLKALRKNYMKLVGAPKVPPKEYFGLQHSLYGFRDFEEMYYNMNLTRSAKIPMDGMVIDLYWFGGQADKFVNGNPETTRFGELEWDQQAFRNPSGSIARLRKQYGVGVTLIEEPFIGLKTQMYKKLESSYALAQKYKFGPPTRIDYNPWWGVGGIIDWTSPNSTLWHDCKRCALIEGCQVDERQCAGLPKTNYAADITGHWIDLGEPELYNDDQVYWGYNDDQNYWMTDEASVHNIFQLLSSKAMHDGYVRKKLRRRPSSLVRTGTSGIHRYGSALWSADISAYLPVLGNHYGAQKHIIMAGIDYFGSDIGGFHRQGVTARPELAQRGVTMNSSYSLWLANAVFTDVPVRVHANQHGIPGVDTNPAIVGDVLSNTYNIRTRYALFPYYYSLGHRAHTEYEPVFVPMFLAYESDPNVRSMGDQMMIGEALMVAPHTQYFENQRSVYLPSGAWYDYRTLELFQSRGQSYNRPLTYQPPGYAKEVRVVPLFVKAGSILPVQYVDEQTMNNLGRRLDQTQVHAQVVRVFLSPESETSSRFVIVDDDGETPAYEQGQRASTAVEFTQKNKSVTVQYAPTQGTFQGALSQRPYVIEVVLPPNTAFAASWVLSLNGQPLRRLEKADYVQPQSGFVVDATGRVATLFSAALDVKVEKVFTLVMA